MHRTDPDRRRSDYAARIPHGPGNNAANWSKRCATVAMSCKSLENTCQKHTV